MHRKTNRTTQEKTMLSIVIVAHDRVELTRRCLEAVCQAQIPCEYELMLVGNCCTDDTADLHAEFSGRIVNLKYVSNERNLSFSKANNAAAELARGRWLLFLNNDVMVWPQSIGSLLEAMEQNPEVGVAGAKLLYPDSGTIQHAGMFQMLWGYASNYGVGGRADDARFNTTKEVFAVTGAMLCIERRLFGRLRGFNEGFWYGYEDVDLCLKARKAGRRVLYVPGVSGFHYESTTLKDVRSTSALEANYAHYRARWDSVLAPREEEFLADLRHQGIHRVVVHGTGRAAAGLFEALSRGEINVIAFASSQETNTGDRLLDRPVVSLQKLCEMAFDRIIVGSQYFFQVEDLLAGHDPQRSAIFPVIS
jgi:GT2 family glycosyltransferase